MATNTIFDDVFRTMQEKMPEQTIPLINDVFGTQYSIDTKIIQGRNEHHTENGEVITDSYLGIGGKRYHIECQSTEDQTMVLRMIELVSRIVDYIFSKQQEVKKGLGEIMGGKVLELESDRLIKKGEKSVTELTKKLLAENRLDDLKRSVEDLDYQRKLLQEMENTK